MPNLRLFIPLCALLLSPLGGAAVPAYGQVAGQAAEQAPPDVVRDLHRAELAWRSGGSLLEAKARADRVLARAPDLAAARRLRAHVLLGMARPAEALADARRAVALETTAEGLLLVAEAARLSNLPDEAHAALDRVAGLAVTDAALHVRLAWNAAEMGLYDRAEAFARIAIQQDPALPGGYVQLARIFARQGERDAAASVLVRALNLGVLDGPAIEQDETLRPLLAHPDVQALLH